MPRPSLPKCLPHLGNAACTWLRRFAGDFQRTQSFSRCFDRTILQRPGHHPAAIEDVRRTVPPKRPRQHCINTSLHSSRTLAIATIAVLGAFGVVHCQRKKSVRGTFLLCNDQPWLERTSRICARNQRRCVSSSKTKGVLVVRPCTPRRQLHRAILKHADIRI